MAIEVLELSNHNCKSMNGYRAAIELEVCYIVTALVTPNLNPGIFS